jgi:hypothetical protein
LAIGPLNVDGCGGVKPSKGASDEPFHIVRLSLTVFFQRNGRGSDVYRTRSGRLRSRGGVVCPPL